MRKPKKQKKPLNDLSHSLTPFEPNQTLIAVIELSKKIWLVAGIIPGIERQPLKKLTADENELLKLLDRWRAEAEKAGHKINRIAVAFEAGRDGFWLARWLRTRAIEAHVIHAASVAVSREHRRAKTDRLDTHQLKRAFLGWLRGERDHCKMCRRPDLRRGRCQTPPSRARDPRWRANHYRQPHQGDPGAAWHSQLRSQAREGPGALATLRTPEGEPIPPNALAELRRDMARKQLVAEQIRQIEKSRLEQIKQAPKAGQI